MFPRLDVWSSYLDVISTHY